MGRNIIGDSICVLRVKVETENGFDAQVAEKIGELRTQVKAGIFDENYPRSLVDYVAKNIGNILNVEISGPRSAIAIPLRVAKNFSPESGQRRLRTADKGLPLRMGDNSRFANRRKFRQPRRI